MIPDPKADPGTRYKLINKSIDNMNLPFGVVFLCPFAPECGDGSLI